MESKTTKSYRHCPGQEYEISIFICRGRQKAHYPKCPECEFRTTTEEISPIPVKEEKKKTQPPATLAKTGSIMVKSEPPSAVIFLDDDNIGVTPAIITQIHPGKYKIKIKMDGYNVWSQSVDVKANKETSLTAVLQGKDCSVVIASKPTNAEISIDGNDAGVTPATIDNVKTGKHLVEVKLDGYEVWSREINVEIKKKTSLTAELTTKYGSISLNSEPTKAIIFLDGNEISTTPASLKSVLLGTHLVEVRMDGYSVWKKSVNVKPGKETVLTATLQVNSGSANIKSQPKSARIFLDGKHVGTTPKSIPSINPGIHEIRIEMDNYDAWTETINIEAGKENVIAAVLQRSTGSLMVESDPANAVIFVDGKEIGHTPEIIMSSAKGTHDVEVRMDGYDIWKKDVDIEPGTEKSVTAILKLKTGSLTINSKPSGGTIFLNGKEAGTTPGNLKGLKLGTHQVEVKIVGYETWSESVSVDADKENKLNALLQILTGSLNIKSEPANATIIIDDNEIGRSPAEITDLKPGKHIVEIRTDGYENWRKSVDIEHSKQTSLTVELQQLTGTLNVKSEPANATIFVDGNEIGKSPVDVPDLKPGKYHVEVKIDGYENWSENVDIEHSKQTSLTVELQQLTGTLNIKSEPANATIFVDDNEIGKSPVDVTDLKPGKHLVEVRMDGYESWSESVDIEHSKKASLIAELQQLTGTLNIKSEPTNAAIFVDSNEVGKSPADVPDLKPGKYLVEVKMDGYENWSESVDIEHSKQTSLTVELQQLTGTLNIKSEPANAAIFIDSNEVGKSPTDITDLKPDKYLVEVRMDGYENWSESVDIDHSKQTSLTVELQQLTGTLNIKSEPANATIFVDGNEIGRSPVDVTDLKPGKHLVEAKMDGYEKWSESVEIEHNKKASLMLELLQLTGTLNIKSEPANAAIFVDSNEVGKSPADITNLKPGKHLVEVRMDGYENWSESVDIEHSKKASMIAELQQLTGTLNIISEPANATIFVDNNEVGKSPADITNLKPGKYLVEVRMDGYEDWSESVDIEHSKKASLMVELQQLTGTLNIKSEPANATIIIDGNEIGTTPLIITDPSPGSHKVEIKRDGYEIWSKNVEIEMGKEADLTAVLKLKAGSFTINSVPSAAIVFIDGNEVDATPLTITDPGSGKHSVEVKMDGYEDWSEDINIVPGKAVALTATLQIKAGTVNVTSEPSDAVIFIDGNEVGRTPVIITDPSPGTHMIELKMNEFETWSKSVEIMPGKEVVLTAVLQSKAGSVCIKSHPPNALAFVEGEEIGKTPLTITNSSPGTYLVEIRMDGYETWNKSFDIEQGKKITITADLQMKAGSININSNPSEAMICIDGKKMGNTPETITDLSPGIHLVEVIMVGYEAWSESVDIRGDKENSLTAKLQKITGSINIISNPPEAAIFLDGKMIGITPCTLESVAIDTHEVEIKMEGYAEWKKTLNVKKGKVLTLNAVLQSNTGTVSIESDPAGAIAFLDGKDVGKTPLSLTGIKIGIYEVEMQKEGYVSWKKSIKIKADRVGSLTAKLMEMTGAVNINSKPSNAIVCIDGKEVGNTPAIITDLTASKHQVEVKMDGYEIWSESVNINPGKEFAVTAELQVKPGSVSINSDPSNALILIDSKEVGTTPKIITDLSLEEHLVEVKMDGYEVWSESINMGPGIEISVMAELQMKAGSVSISSEPSNAIILIDTKKAGSTPETLTGIVPGKHHVEISLEGYETWSESVEVGSDKENSVVAVLNAITGSISIESNPLEATIFLDGKDIGTTPDTIRYVAIGTHEIEVRKIGYAEWSKRINIKKGKEVTLNAALQPVTGTARLESDPAGAMIFFDGENIGKTPKVMTGINSGKHDVEISLEGYESCVQKIKIKAGRESVFTAKLLRKKGSLTLNSDPSNATIYIQGKKSGKTPRTITELIPGNYTIEVMLNEYQTWSGKADIIPGEEITIKAELQEKPGSINIKSKPSDAKILLDGDDAGTTPESINDIESGTHVVELIMEGYDVWSENVEVKPDKESYLTAVLQEMVGSVSIKSEPSNAMILVDGNKAGTTPAIIKDLSPGTHMVDISMDGYNAWSESVEIVGEQETELTAMLQELTGTVTINSIPADASILIDGKEVGTTPETISDIKIGTHKVEVSIDGYGNWSENIEVTDKVYNMTATLQEKTGAIDIKSEPSNATILINGNNQGSTPETIKNLKPGIHEVEVKADEFETWSSSVEVTAEKQSTVTAMLQKASGSINVTSTPENANIYIDGEEAGTTPTTLSSISIGTHEIEVKIDGYENWKKSIIIKKEKEMGLNAILQLNIGSINIESYPENAIIILDCKNVGNAPKRLTDIIVGSHEVEVLLDGYVTWKKTIKVKAEKEISLTANLKKDSSVLDIEADKTTKAPEISKPITQETSELKPKPEKISEKPISQPLESTPSSDNKKTKYSPDKLIKLRSVCDKIPGSKIESLPFITVNEKNNNIFFCHSSINHRYELKPIADGDVVIDHTTELMWQQSGSEEYFSLKKANKWLKKINKKSYAGFNDWRFPTLEEASSLLEFGTKSGKFIHTIFDDKQWGTWTGDKSDKGLAWIVTYVNGTISQVQAGNPATFVRPVRSLNI